MMRYAKYTEWLYLIVAVLSAYKLITLWDAEQEVDYLFLFFLVVSVGMFFFRRHYRKKFENRNNS